MQQYFVPDIYVEHSALEQKPTIESFSSLYISKEIGSFCLEPIVLTSILDIEKYDFLSADLMLTHCIKVYFNNGGERLYILSMPDDFNEFENYLASRCDRLVDLESMAIVQLVETQEEIKLQNLLSRYCEKSHRVSVCSVADISIVDKLDNTTCFYPNMYDKNNNLIPSFVYATALFSFVGRTQNIADSVANIELKNCVKLSGDSVIKKGINRVINTHNQGIKLWGVRTLNSDIDFINTQRVLLYIKRTILYIIKWSIFEPNSEQLQEKLIRQIKNFLYKLYKNQALKGDTEAEAFSIVCDSRNNSTDDYSNGKINFDIGVSIAKPLEFIVIRFNRVENDNNQATINLT